MSSKTTDMRSSILNSLITKVWRCRNLLAIAFAIFAFSSALLEASLGLSLRIPTSACFIGLCMLYAYQKRITFGPMLLAYMLLALLYLIAYYSIGPRNYLIIHVYTLIIATIGSYLIMRWSSLSADRIWLFIEGTWLGIYATLLLEPGIIAFGQQHLLPNFLPPQNYRIGLPGYYDLDNTFSNHFHLSYRGLNSFLLIPQAYAQLCALLTAFVAGAGGFFSNTSKLNKCLVFVVIPLLLILINPNVTATLIVISIAFANLLIQRYLGAISFRKTSIFFCVIMAVVLFLYIFNVGFIRKYNLFDFYSQFVAPQISYARSATTSEDLIGMGIDKFLAESKVSEVGLLLYASATGMIFALLNLAMLIACIFRNLHQIRYLLRNGLISRKRCSSQITNILLMLGMLISAIHFPVIFSMIGSLLFSLNIAFCLFCLFANHQAIIASGGIVPNALSNASLKCTYDVS